MTNNEIAEGIREMMTNFNKAKTFALAQGMTETDADDFAGKALQNSLGLKW